MTDWRPGWLRELSEGLVILLVFVAVLGGLWLLAYLGVLAR